jgi:hypothetical protein
MVEGDFGMSEQPPTGPYEQMPGQPPTGPYQQSPQQPRWTGHPQSGGYPLGGYSQNGAYLQGGGYPAEGRYSQGGSYPQDGGFAPGPGGPQYPYFPPPQPKKRHRLRTWLIIATAVFAGIIGAAVAIGIAAGSAANKAANPVSAQSATPNALNSAESAAASCNSAGGSWNGSSCAPASSAPSLPSGPAMLAPGQGEPVSIGSSSQTAATITVESINVSTQPAQAYGSAPANGYFVVIQVKAAVDSSYTDGFQVNQYDFYDLVRGHHYDPDNGNAYDALSDSQSNQDITATLGAGETSSGWIAFDVPHPHGYIVYAPNANGQPLAEWKY